MAPDPGRAYTGIMIGTIRKVLEADRRIAYALLFGSAARGSSHPHSDIDVAVGLIKDQHLNAHAFGDLVSQLESAAGLPVDLVVLEEASPVLAYRVFRDGVVVAERDHRALVTRKAKAILDYLDFKPVEELCTKGVLTSASHGR